MLLKSRQKISSYLGTFIIIIIIINNIIIIVFLPCSSQNSDASFSWEQV